MSVKINVASFSYEHTNGRKVVETRGSTVGGCLGDLVAQFPGLAEVLFEQDGKLRDHLHIYVNSEPVYPVEMARQVKDGDELHIVRMMSGGAHATLESMLKRVTEDNTHHEVDTGSAMGREAW